MPHIGNTNAVASSNGTVLYLIGIKIPPPLFRTANRAFEKQSLPTQPTLRSRR